MEESYIPLQVNLPLPHPLYPSLPSPLPPPYLFPFPVPSFSPSPYLPERTCYLNPASVVSGLTGPWRRVGDRRRTGLVGLLLLLFARDLFRGA